MWSGLVRGLSGLVLGLSVLLAGSMPLHAASPQKEDAAAAPVCIDAGNIDHLSYPDDKTILFHMRSGKVRIWKNTLKHACPNMKIQGGIAYEIHGGTICSEMQIFYVIRYWNPCTIGTFTPYTPPKKSADTK